MGNQQQPGGETATHPNVIDLTRRIGEHAARMVAHALSGEDHPAKFGLGSSDPLGLRDALPQLGKSLLREPAPFFQMQASLARDYAQLCQHMARHMLGMGTDNAPLVKPDPGDQRFRDPAWQEHPYFDTIKQAYLLATHAWVNLVHSALHLDDSTRQKLEFAVRQVSNAMAPSNFVATNPEALQATIASGGGNLLAGLENLLDDLERSQGQWEVSTTDHDAFSVGENLAISPGKVIFQNDLLQLIQYEPTTKKVARRPLLIIPP